MSQRGDDVSVLRFGSRVEFCVGTGCCWAIYRMRFNENTIKHEFQTDLKLKEAAAEND